MIILMTKTILLATVVAVTILGLTTASMVINNTAEASHGACLTPGTAFSSGPGLCVEIGSDPGCPFADAENHCTFDPPVTLVRDPVRDNVDIENIKLKNGQFRVIVDNAGIGATSDVEITWNFDVEKCEVIAAGDVGGFATVGLVDDGAFSVGAGVPVGHNDVKFAEAILLGVVGDAKDCKIDSKKGQYVSVSTIGMGGPGPLDTSNPSGP